MATIENNQGGLGDAPFSYSERGGGKVFISWRGRHVKILKGDKAASFLYRIAGLNTSGQQLVMAKITGNFKRGNEQEK